MKKRSTVQPEDRKPVLEATRNLKMAAFAHAYVRGSTVRFYEWLDDAGHAKLPEGPPVWICGDCHLGNLGPVANAEGQIQIQIRDLDQTVIGNPAHDLVRLGLSLAMAARSSDLPGVATAHIIEQLIEGYLGAFGDDGEDDDPPTPDTVKLVLREAAGRSWKHLADERIEGSAPVIPLGKRFWPLLDEEREALRQVFGQEDLRRLVTSLRSRKDNAAVEMVDAAYWRKGCSSLGRLRFAVLLSIEEGEGHKRRQCLIDVKEAIGAAAPRYAGGHMPADNAERVIQGAQHLSPHLGSRMLSARMLDRAVFIRELLPQDLKLEIESMTKVEAMQIARYLAAVVGHAHRRQMGAADRLAWRKELAKRGTRTMDAPSWLWSSIVDLVASHEAAYLDHCRRYALAAESA